MGTVGLCTLFDTEKYFLVYWEDEDSVSADVKDPPPEKAVIGDTVKNSRSAERYAMERSLNWCFR